MSVLEQKGYYRPFKYSWAEDAATRQNQMHWLGSEIKMHQDSEDFWNNLERAEIVPNKGADAREFLTQLFRFFTQADTDVHSAYMNQYAKTFKNEEIQDMFSAFSNMEVIHKQAYALLLDSVGMPEVEYLKFKEYEAMAKKHEYLLEYRGKDLHSIAKALAVFSAFTEGMQLFSSFAMLLNFARSEINVMKGMATVVTLSVIDESLHTDSMIKLFRTFIEEHPRIWTDEFKKELYDISRRMVELEDHFIDLAFDTANNNLKGITKDDTKRYIRYICNRRLNQLGLKSNWIDITDNPFPWIEEILGAVGHTNFFENKEVGYAKGTIKGSPSDIWGKYTLK